MIFNLLPFVLLLFLFIISTLELEIPVSLTASLNGDNQIEHSLVFNCSETSTIEAVVIGFCETHSIYRRFCGILFRKALESLRASEPDCTHLIDKRFENNIHPHLIQNHDSLDNQRFNTFVRRDCQHLPGSVLDSNESEMEAAVDDYIYDSFLRFFREDNNRTRSSPRDERRTIRVCFVHSCLLPNRSTDILQDILQQIHDSSLIDELSHVWVLNYGDDLTQRHAFQDMLTRFPTVAFIQRSADPSRFEVPTLRHIHTFASRVYTSLYPRPPATIEDGVDIIDSDSRFRDPEQDIQILYLHTKGVSYREKHVAVEDWTRMMLYFLIEEHRRCFHLLASGDFDAVGTNCHPNPHLHFSGNILTPLEFDQAGKFAAEFWPLSLKEVPRVKDLHLSFVDHYGHPYPREKYVSPHKYR
eukprot:gene33637-43472_t